MENFRIQPFGRVFHTNQMEKNKSVIPAKATTHVEKNYVSLSQQSELNAIMNKNPKIYIKSTMSTRKLSNSQYSVSLPTIMKNNRAINEDNCNVHYHATIRTQ